MLKNSWACWVLNNMVGGHGDLHLSLIKKRTSYQIRKAGNIGRSAQLSHVNLTFDHK